MWPKPQQTADLVTFTEEILNEKLIFLCSFDCSTFTWGLKSYKAYNLNIETPSYVWANVAGFFKLIQTKQKNGGIFWIIFLMQNLFTASWFYLIVKYCIQEITKLILFNHLFVIFEFYHFSLIY